MSTKKKQELDTLKIANMEVGVSINLEKLSLHSGLVEPPELITILENRFREAQLCLAYSPIATIMLCGSLLEGLLLGLANKKPSDFNSSLLSPKDKKGKTKPFKEWNLAQFIDVAHDLGILRLDVKNFGHPLRNFRNYIHPYRQIKEDFYPDRYTAEMCLLTVKATIHNLNTTPKTIPEKISGDWTKYPDAAYLALAILFGSWNEKNRSDIKAIAQMLDIDYDSWLHKAREVLHISNSPLSFKNGIWKVVNRTELWSQLGSYILDQNLENFKRQAVSILKEPDPVFELPPEERYAASIYGKVMNFSHEIRKGVAEGLAILGNYSDACINCSSRKAKETSAFAIRKILFDADWNIWGSLNEVLPTLAEAAPNEFLDAVENALKITPSPFNKLFAQEDGSTFGNNYLTGLLWALEGLAWDEQYLVRVCVILGELASLDPGGSWANRPSNSLRTIFLPWMPQTLASFDKRKVAVKSLIKEFPDIAWKLIITLLPGQHQTSFGTYKPNWRMIIPDGWEQKKVIRQKYLQQVSFYAMLAVEAADHDIDRLCILIDHFNNLPRQAFDQLLEILTSHHISEFTEEHKLLLWDHLTKFTKKHRRFSDADWALPDEMITRLENVTKEFTPSNPFRLYQHLFTYNDFELYEKNSDWEDQKKKFDRQREIAIIEILKQKGVEGVIRFAEFVISPGQVGNALGVIEDSVIDNTLFPKYLVTTDKNHKALISGYIWRRYNIKGWDWCDNIYKSSWTKEQIGFFLSCLPFNKEVWGHAAEWLGKDEIEYWSRTGANAYEADDHLSFAIDKLIEYDRPRSAINCLYKMQYNKQPINVKQCAQALLEALSSHEPIHVTNRYHILYLIKFLQSESSVEKEDLLKVEWAYLPLLDRFSGAAPKFLENELANDPEFFCEVIKWIYRPKNEDQPVTRPNEELESIANNAWKLLHEWKIPPGTQDNGTFNAEKFDEWLQHVKFLCTESGHLEVALIKVGEVLIHSPSDPDGLWIHRTVANALNDRDADIIRDGFMTGILNSRGVYTVDPTGKPEFELAKQYRLKADEVENAGFHRLATTLRDVADSYERQAERIVAEH